MCEYVCNKILTRQSGSGLRLQYQKGDTLTEIIAQKNPGNCLILTLIWTSENAATSTLVSPYMSRKTFGGWGFAPDPEWRLISPLLYVPPDSIV